MRHVTRREFVQGAAVVLGSAHLVRGQAASSPNAASMPGGRSTMLKGFIVSDAHFGWVDAQQPTPERQIDAMRHIMERFPDLDIFFDTGDAHHNGDNRDRQRGQWSDIIAGGCGVVPFYYVAGNHEICHARDADVELRCNTMGSVSCRPYYSVDVMDIHFVSLPELTRAVYLNKESLEWLALDLELSRDKSTILLSHNNILGTTTGDEPGYRGLVQSAEMLALLDRYPNVLAWMHGHNHNFEVVERRGKLFVSNGRIGGFDPSRKSPEGSHGIGGIYFEIGPDGLTVRCYSAERKAFLDQLGIRNVAGVLKTRTTLDRRAPAGYSYGVGGARDGQRVPLLNHHAGPDSRLRVSVCGTADPVINDDPGFSLYAVRRNDRNSDPQLMGSGVVGPPGSHEWLNPGLRIKASSPRNRPVTLVVPRQGHNRYTYYRCPPGRAYRATLDLNAGPGGQQLQVAVLAYDSGGRELARLVSPAWTLAPGRQSKDFVAEIPAFSNGGTIYTDPAADNLVHLMIQADFSQLTVPVDVHRFEFAFADARGATDRPVIILDGHRAAFDRSYAPTTTSSLRMPAPAAPRSMVEVQVGGNRLATWLVTHTGIEWQVRNAPVVQTGQTLRIGPLRNRFSKRNEIIIAPLVRPAPVSFVHRIRNADIVRIELSTKPSRILAITLENILGLVEVDLITPRSPRDIRGADGARTGPNGLVIQKNQTGRIEIDLA